MKIPFVDLYKQYLSIKEEIDQAISAVIERTAFIGNANNEFVKNFEEEFSEFIGANYCVGCGNGTDAIEILLKAFEIGVGDEVIVPAFTWIATSEAVSGVGATPVFVDIEPNFFCINPAKIEEKISSRTKAIIPVHLYGHPAQMEEILSIATKYDLKVIEDCAQAHGAEIDQRKIGTFGDAASFSFFPGKNLGAFGDAGGIVTNNEEIAQRARMISQHGQLDKKHKHYMEGRNSRLDGLQAAILSVKIKYLQQWNELRISHAKTYHEMIENPDVDLPKVREGCKHVFHLFVIKSTRRDEMSRYLFEKGVSTAIQYPKGLPFLDPYRFYGYPETDFKCVSRIQNEILSLPIYPELDKNQVSYICDTVVQYLKM